MGTPLRSAAQQRADEIAIFQAELARLEAEGVLRLDPARQQAVREHHAALLAGFAGRFDIDRDVQAKQLSLGMRVASFLGALALAAGVFFLFYQFWGRFEESAQVAILLGAALASMGLTVWIQTRDTSGYFTKLAAMVAFACFVLDLSMLGEIFNITPTDRALIPWAALAFLLAYACDLRLLLAAGICCVIAFVAARVGEWGGIYWLNAGERPENFFPVAALLFAVPVLVTHRRLSGFASIYRVLDAGAANNYYGGFGYTGGTPEWVDAAKMAALGFDVGAVADDSTARRRLERALPRKVLLVLELAGPAWQQTLERARQNAARNEAARLANADSKEFAEKARQAQEQLKREETLDSRLFAIDAGLDRAALRAQYPDRSRYLILQGTLRPRLVVQDKKTRVTGYVSAVAATRINVPHALRPALESALGRHQRKADDPAPHFEATMAVGQRLEPWIASVVVAR